MKKSILILASLVVSLCACADREQIISYAELPVQAQSFIKKFFNVDDVSHIQRERDGMQMDYNVYLKGGIEIDFDHQGNLESIDCQRSSIPNGVLPELIANHILLNYPDYFAVEYVIDYRHLKVELNNGLELIFDLEGHFIRIDD